MKTSFVVNLQNGEIYAFVGTTCTAEELKTYLELKGWDVLDVTDEGMDGWQFYAVGGEYYMDEEKDQIVLRATGKVA